MVEILRTELNAAFTAEPLWEYLSGYSNTGTVDIVLPAHNVILRVRGEEMFWEDALMVRELGQRQMKEISDASLNEFYLHFFRVARPESFEGDNLQGSFCYVDPLTLRILDRRGVISWFKPMPKPLYDLALEEAYKRSWEV